MTTAEPTVSELPAGFAATATKTDFRRHEPVWRTRAQAREVARRTYDSGRVFRCLGCGRWHIQYVTVYYKDSDGEQGAGEEGHSVPRGGQAEGAVAQSVSSDGADHG